MYKIIEEQADNGIKDQSGDASMVDYDEVIRFFKNQRLQ